MLSDYASDLGNCQHIDRICLNNRWTELSIFRIRAMLVTRSGLAIWTPALVILIGAAIATRVSLAVAWGNREDETLRADRLVVCIWTADGARTGGAPGAPY